MRRARVFAALAAVLTALLLQATLVAPWSGPVPVSLPAVVVAAVALVDGPGAGIPFGFAAGLIADLGSTHPAGVLAVCWLLVGLVCGLAADRATVRRDAAVAALGCALAAALGTILLTVVHSGGATVGAAAGRLLPSLAGDALLALAVVPLVRAMLHTPSLRAPHPVLTELDVVGGRG